MDYSIVNLRYMCWFFELYFENPQQLAVDCIDEMVFKIPWGHHIQIIGKCRKDVKKAFFYVHKTLENNWSRAVLLNFLDTDLYEPTYEGLKVFYPKLVKGGVIIVHDYNSTQFSGVKKAVKRFCEEADVSVLPLSDMHGSAVLIK